MNLPSKNVLPCKIDVNVQIDLTSEKSYFLDISFQGEELLLKRLLRKKVQLRYSPTFMVFKKRWKLDYNNGFYLEDRYASNGYYLEDIFKKNNLIQFESSRAAEKARDELKKVLNDFLIEEFGEYHSLLREQRLFYPTSHSPEEIYRIEKDKMSTLEIELSKKLAEIETKMLDDEEFAKKTVIQFKKLNNLLFYHSYTTLRSLTWKVDSNDLDSTLFHILVHEIADDFHNLPAACTVKDDLPYLFEVDVIINAISTLCLVKKLVPGIGHRSLLNDICESVPELAGIIRTEEGSEKM